MIRAIKRKSGYILALIMIAILISCIYYFGIYGALEENRKNLLYKIEETDNQLNIEKDKETRILDMNSVIDRERKSGTRIYEYNNERNELEYLSELMAETQDYDLSFSEPVLWNDSYVRRPVSFNFNADNYKVAAGILERIINCPYRTIIKDVVISPYGGSGTDSIEDRSLSGNSRVSVSAEVIFIEYVDETTDTRGLYEQN